MGCLKVKTSGVDSVGSRMEMGICFGIVSSSPSSPAVHVRELPEFLPLMMRDRSNWPRCLLWHGVSRGQLAVGVLVSYPVDRSCLWVEIGRYSCVWPDGRLDPFAGVSVAGAGCLSSCPRAGRLSRFMIAVSHC